ncbi:hypothetical protein SAICODRAFT_161928 [Saitoella complicata NRRL Y-17804]|uniref:uncharacterized protein n=1 Tax=Saitoella complicata (strain BCRC 22490 / CBS 7301 / JCM 7358 / NBRC 10748 / NRRL Y-17804) TaxID=698492 RepID=UPI000866A6D1|nr:uncharacterized protein SAICODRAFT_161928 [Saitoella complicata NRRL Y-17804]ODQ51044.1 hypothetical protein SAICODRAFT_161928 [Saitoella complicata NRRL Y-17804]
MNGFCMYLEASYTRWKVSFYDNCPSCWHCKLGMCGLRSCSHRWRQGTAPSLSITYLQVCRTSKDVFVEYQLHCSLSRT